MAVVQSHEPVSEIARRVDRLKAELDRRIQYSPQTVWRRISTPMRHPGAALQAQPDAFQRVLVCAAEGMASFYLVHWLGRHHSEEVVHRRFSGAYDLDVGSDYVDFNHDGRVLRLIAMARKGLALPLTRAFLPDYSHVVLLLSGNNERDTALAQRVAQACSSLATPPTLLGVARDAGGHNEMFALARRCGLCYVGTHCDTADDVQTWQAIEPLLDDWQDVADGGWPVVPLRA
jgi:hypothetical protein